MDSCEVALNFASIYYVSQLVSVSHVFSRTVVQVEQCRRLAETLISSYPECDTPGLIQAAQYVRQKNTGQAIECLQVCPMLASWLSLADQCVVNA